MSDDPEELFKRQVRKLANGGQLRDCLFLVSKGIPYDVAFSLPEDMRLAYIIVLGELGGGVKWDWSLMEFVPTQANP